MIIPPRYRFDWSDPEPDPAETWFSEEEVYLLEHEYLHLVQAPSDPWELLDNDSRWDMELVDQVELIDLELPPKSS